MNSQELEKLNKNIVNKHVPWQDQIVGYALFSKFQQLTRICDSSAQDWTMKYIINHDKFHGEFNLC